MSRKKSILQKGSGLQPRLHEYSQRRKERSSIGEAKLCSKYTTPTHVSFSSYNFQPDAFLNVAVPSQAEKLRKANAPIFSTFAGITMLWQETQSEKAKVPIE